MSRSAARPLFRRHDPSSQTRYQDTVQRARAQRRVLAGTPGTLKQRIRGGKAYWVREHIRIDGAKDDEHVGPVASVPPERVAAWRADIEAARALATASGALRLAGYQRMDRQPAAVLAILFNHGLWAAGLTLVGSHAYSALLNELGLVAPGFRTRDLDLARHRPMEIALSPGATFATLLADTGLPFAPVPGMPSSRPSASFKLPGADALLVDLLVPGLEAGKVVPVAELGSHGQAIPLLEFLVDDAIDTAILSPNQVVPVRVPAPERFVLHKLYASQSRRVHPGKSTKDIEQAAVLAAALEEDFPGRLREAWRRFPAPGRAAARRGGALALKHLDGVHPGAAELLRKMAKGLK